MNAGPLVEVILYVSDMERSVRFYRDVLGIKPAAPLRDDYSGEFWVVLETGSCKLCLHGGGGQDRGGDAPKIVFHVDDIRASREELVSRGLSVDPVFSPAPVVFVCNSADPDGNRFSLESSSAR